MGGRSRCMWLGCSIHVYVRVYLTKAFDFTSVCVCVCMCLSKSNGLPQRMLLLEEGAFGPGTTLFIPILKAGV